MMEQKELDFLREVTDLRGTSGGEAAVREYFSAKYTGLADRVETDGMGSLLAELGTSGPRILAVGHMDEVGFMVRSFLKKRFFACFSSCRPTIEAMRWPMRRTAMNTPMLPIRKPT